MPFESEEILDNAGFPRPGDIPILNGKVGIMHCDLLLSTYSDFWLRSIKAKGEMCHELEETTCTFLFTGF